MKRMIAMIIMAVFILTQTAPAFATQNLKNETPAETEVAAAVGKNIAEAGATGVIAEIFADSDNSAKIADELRRQKLDTLKSLLSNALREGKLHSLENKDYGAALAWLIKNFPMRHDESITGQYALVDETPYRLIIRMLILYNITALLPDTVSIEQKIKLAESILPVLLCLSYEVDKYGDVLNQCANEFIRQVSLPVAIEVEKILPNQQNTFSNTTKGVTDSGKETDITLMGPNAVQLAEQQGWYKPERSFVLYQIGAAYFMTPAICDQFHRSLKKGLVVASSEAVGAQANGKQLETDEQIRNEALRLRIVGSAEEWLRKTIERFSNRLEILSSRGITIDMTELIDIIYNKMPASGQLDFVVQEREFLKKFELGASGGTITEFGEGDIFEKCKLGVSENKEKLREFSAQCDKIVEQLNLLIDEYQAETRKILDELEAKKIEIKAIDKKYEVSMASMEILESSVKVIPYIKARLNVTQDEAPLWISRTRVLFETNQWVPLEVAIESAKEKVKTGVALVVTLDKTWPIVLRPFDTGLKVELSTPEELDEVIKRITEAENKQIVVVINDTNQDLPQDVMMQVGQVEVIGIYGQEINEKDMNRHVEEALLRSV